MSPPSLRTLSDLAVGETAVVRHVRGERRTTVRLLEMGLVPGTRVELRRRAPLGDPLELRVRGYMLSIRKTEALGIEVEPAASVVADRMPRPLDRMPRPLVEATEAESELGASTEDGAPSPGAAT